MHVQRQIDQLLAQRAAEWMEALKTGGAAEREGFVQWLRQSKLHVEQYLELVAIDRELQALDAAAGEDIEELLRRVAPNVLRLDPKPRGRSSVLGAPLSHRTHWRVGIAAGIATVAAALAWQPGGRFASNKVSTAVGEQRSMTLADGSVMTLNAMSAVKIEFAKSSRTVLLERGEAVFKVAPDAARPFVVHTGAARVQALGTQFNVDRRSDGVVVSVLEGRVRVSADASTARAESAEAAARQELAAGEEVQVRADGRMEKRAHADVSKVLAWRERRLFFDETPLEEIVGEFNRYGRSVQIRLEGIEAGTRRYGGIFDADDPNSLADLLSREPDLVVERRPGLVVIRHR